MKLKSKVWLMTLVCLLTAGVWLGGDDVAAGEPTASATEEPTTNADEFNIWNNILLGYTGEGGEIVIPEGVVQIGKFVFLDNVKLTKVVLPKSVKTIQAHAFKGCTQLKEVSLNAGLEELEGEAFYGCSELTAVTIPATVSAIGNRAFGNCTKVEKFEVAEGSQNFMAIEGVLFQTKGTQRRINNYGENWAFMDAMHITGLCLQAYPSAKVGDYVIPVDTESCAPYAFEGCQGLTGVTLTKNEEYIMADLFLNCSNLTSVKFAEGIIGIGPNAFEGCTSLTVVQTPDTLQIIGLEAFKGCSQLRQIDLGPRLTKMAQRVFEGCTSLAAFTVDAANAKYSAKDGILYNRKQSEVLMCPLGREGAVTFDAKVTSIGPNAFQGCTKLTEITVPNHIGEIGMGAFKDCTALAKVQLSERLRVVRMNAFENCVGLTEVTLPGYVAVIEGEAFKGCANIAKMVVPESMRKINGNSFEGCDKLVIYGGAKSFAQRFADDFRFGFVEIETKPVKVIANVESKAKKKVKLSWWSAAKTKGYVIQMSTKKRGGFKTIATVKGERKVAFTKGKLKSKKRYYFRMRAYRVVDKERQYGKYSDVMSVKVK